LNSVNKKTSNNVTISSDIDDDNLEVNVQINYQKLNIFKATKIESDSGAINKENFVRVENSNATQSDELSDVFSSDKNKFKTDLESFCKRNPSTTFVIAENINTDTFIDQDSDTAVDLCIKYIDRAFVAAQNFTGSAQIADRWIEPGNVQLPSPSLVKKVNDPKDSDHEDEGASTNEGTDKEKDLETRIREFAAAREDSAINKRDEFMKILKDTDLNDDDKNDLFETYKNVNVTVATSLLTVTQDLNRPFSMDFIGSLARIYNPSTGSKFANDTLTKKILDQLADLIIYNSSFWTNLKDDSQIKDFMSKFKNTIEYFSSIKDNTPAPTNVQMTAKLEEIWMNTSVKGKIRQFNAESTVMPFFAACMNFNTNSMRVLMPIDENINAKIVGDNGDDE
jgi:hypothetical protein